MIIQTSFENDKDNISFLIKFFRLTDSDSNPTYSSASSNLGENKIPLEKPIKF